MSIRLRLIAGIVTVGLATTMASAAAAGARTADPTPVPLQDWAATFCKTFSVYETDALAAQAELQTVLGGVGDTTTGKATTTSLATLMTKASGSAAAAATAATANGAPDVTHGAALTRELRATLKSASKAYAKVAAKAPALPPNPAKLSRAAKKLGTDIAAQLDDQGTHAKRLRKLDGSNAVAKAISADPTCSAAAEAGAATTPAETTP